MNDKIGNSIALHQQTINELANLKYKVSSSEGDIRFRIETKHWYGYSEPFLSKEKSVLDLSKYTMKVVIDEAINKERERINKLIDMEIQQKIAIKGE